MDTGSLQCAVENIFTVAIVICNKAHPSTKPLWAYYTLPSYAGVNKYNKDNMAKVYKSTLHMCIYVVT